MAQTILIKTINEECRFVLSKNVINKSTIKSAFLLSNDTIVSLSYKVNGIQYCCNANKTGTRFILPEGWPDIEFFMKSNRVPATPVDVRPIVNLYPKAPPPVLESIEKWMFYSEGKSTVVCVHPRYFVTFRHGTHLLLQIGSVIKIFKKAEDPPNGFDVTVVNINEKLDFILLHSKENIVKSQWQIDHHKSPPTKKVRLQTEVEGLGRQTLFVDEERLYNFE